MTILFLAFAWIEVGRDRRMSWAEKWPFFAWFPLIGLYTDLSIAELVLKACQ